MLKLKDFTLNEQTLTMTVLIEEDEKKAYRLSVDVKTKYLSVVNSEIPSDCKIYERQAKTALRRYREKELPKTITSMWY